MAGASGVLGRSLVPRLVAAGHDVTGTTRSRRRAEAIRASGASPVVVDNMLMSCEVALPEGESTAWRGESVAAARELSAELLASDRWLASVLPVGDGIAFAARR